MASCADDLRRLNRYIRDCLLARQPVVLAQEHEEMLEMLDKLLGEAAARALYQPLEIEP
jgi:hypothetical protein